MKVFEFSTSSPPTDEQFEAIAQRLLASLCDRMGVVFESTDTHIESGSWVTMKIRSRPIHERIVDIVFDGIISYSLRREDAPSIDSVLLPFSGGKRLSVGRNTILVASYVEDGTAGKWADFRWDFDGYGEWECEDLPDK